MPSFTTTLHDGKCCPDCLKGQFLTWYLVLVDGWTASKTLQFRPWLLSWFGVTEVLVDFRGRIPFTLQVVY